MRARVYVWLTLSFLEYPVQVGSRGQRTGNIRSLRSKQPEWEHFC